MAFDHNRGNLSQRVFSREVPLLTFREDAEDFGTDPVSFPNWCFIFGKVRFVFKTNVEVARSRTWTCAGPLKEPR